MYSVTMNEGFLCSNFYAVRETNFIFFKLYYVSKIYQSIL